MLNRLAILLTLVVGVGLLAACDSAEERAEKHFEKGMQLLEAGETDRALVEFRNVFKLNGYHHEARLAYARVEERRGNIPSAYGQYLRLVEQYPQDLDGRRALARLALETGNWAEVERHVVVAKKLAPDDLMVRAVGTALDYRNALLDQDLAGARDAAAAALELVKADSGLLNARRIVIDDLIRREDWSAAKMSIDEALVKHEDDRSLHRLRLGVLDQLGRNDEIEVHLKTMVERFPEDEGIQRLLIGWYVSRERMSDAESFLRSRIALKADSVDGYVTLVGFLAQHQGRDAARDEVERILVETEVDPALFRSMRAGLDFDAGKQDAAIAEMEDILKDAEPSEQTHRIKIALANMLSRTGNSVGARVQVEEVLDQDPTHIGGLKLKAGWLIDDDHIGDAIVELRRALDQSPRDAQVLTLLARAYERSGNRELMSEMLALAVEASGGAPVEALRYARVLLGEGKLLPAEDVLLDALRLQRDNPELLAALGNVYIQMEDWSRTEHVIETLTRLGTDSTRTAANELTARKLAGQNREADLSAFLGRLAEDDGGLRSIAAVIQRRLATGDVQGALEYVNTHLETDPENPMLRFVAATVLAMQGQPETAEKMFRELLEEVPTRENVWVALYNLYRSRGENEAATAVLGEGLEALPESANLNWVQASELESRGDIEGAIAVYEKLYERNSGSQIIANNLASLISSYRDDDESLERAYKIARRLRGTKTAPFQDTYGWIAHKLGNHEEALNYLRPAAEGLPDDPLVQYHLAMVYAALNQETEAMTQLKKAAVLIEESGRRPEVLDKVKAEIVRLESDASTNN